MSLALKYRPPTFAEVTGQKLAAVPLYRMARLGTVPPALLLSGVRGCGKTSTARILGVALNCEAEDQSADLLAVREVPVLHGGRGRATAWTCSRWTRRPTAAWRRCAGCAIWWPTARRASGRWCCWTRPMR